MSITTEKSPGTIDVRPFQIEIPEEMLTDLRRRIAATRWPGRELVEDRSQGVQLTTSKELARCWSGEYDWRPCETRLNALPQVLTHIDGLDVSLRPRALADGAPGLHQVRRSGW